MALTPQQQRQLYERGYLHLPAAIPREHVERCRRKIHHDIGRHGLDPNELTRFRARSYCPELQNDPDFTGLARSPEPWALLTAALGEGNVAVSEWVQIALRFPSMQEEPRRPKWHIDGVPTPDNGMPPDQIEHFTCLLGVVLADVTEPNRGNFTVWPGGHRKIEQWFCENPKENCSRAIQSWTSPSRTRSAPKPATSSSPTTCSRTASGRTPAPTRGTWSFSASSTFATKSSATARSARRGASGRACKTSRRRRRRSDRTLEQRG